MTRRVAGGGLSLADNSGNAEGVFGTIPVFALIFRPGEDSPSGAGILSELKQGRGFAKGLAVSPVYGDVVAVKQAARGKLNHTHTRWTYALHPSEHGWPHTKTPRRQQRSGAGEEEAHPPGAETSRPARPLPLRLGNKAEGIWSGGKEDEEEEDDEEDEEGGGGGGRGGMRPGRGAPRKSRDGK